MVYRMQVRKNVLLIKIILNTVKYLKPDQSDGDVDCGQIILNMGAIYCVIIYQISLQLCLYMDTVLTT